MDNYLLVKLNKALFLKKAQFWIPTIEGIEKLRKEGINYNISYKDVDKVCDKVERESNINDISIDTPNSGNRAKNK